MLGNSLKKKQVKLRSTLTPKTWQLEVVGGGGKDMIMSIVSNTQSTSGKHTSF